MNESQKWILINLLVNHMYSYMIIFFNSARLKNSSFSFYSSIFRSLNVFVQFAFTMCWIFFIQDLECLSKTIKLIIGTFSEVIFWLTRGIFVISHKLFIFIFHTWTNSSKRASYKYTFIFASFLCLEDKKGSNFVNRFYQQIPT